MANIHRYLSHDLKCIYGTRKKRPDLLDEVTKTTQICIIAKKDCPNFHSGDKYHECMLPSWKGCTFLRRFKENGN